MKRQLTDRQLIRFWAKVGSVKPGECWPWIGGKSNSGYGYFRLGEQVLGSHCISYEMAVALIPKPLVIHHKCRVRNCVNPAHMRVVTQRVNILEESDSIQARNAAKTHCHMNHPFDFENTYIRRRTNPNGQIRIERKCKACQRDYQRLHAVRLNARRQQTRRTTQKKKTD